MASRKQRQKPEWVQFAESFGESLPECCDAPDDEPSGYYYERFKSPYSVSYQDTHAELARERARCISGSGDYSRRTGRAQVLGRMREHKIDGWLECRAGCAAERAELLEDEPPDEAAQYVLLKRGQWVGEPPSCVGGAAYENFVLALLIGVGKLLAIGVGYLLADKAVEELSGGDEAAGEQPPGVTWGPYVRDARAAVADARARLKGDTLLSRVALSMASRLDEAVGPGHCKQPWWTEPPWPPAPDGEAIAYQCSPAVDSETLRASTVVLRHHIEAALGGPAPAVRVAGVDYGDGAEPVKAVGSSAGTWLAVGAALVAAWLLWGRR